MIVPRLEPGDVHVWHVDLAGEGEGADASLDADERGRAARFAFAQDRRRYRGAHAALRRVLGAYLGIDPATVSFRSLDHGKPALEGAELAFNLSHSGDAAIVAVSREPGVGIDLEARGAPAQLRALARSVFTAGEYAALEGLEGEALESAFLRGWTRKEACLKALGVGLTVEPASLHAGVEAARGVVRASGLAGAERLEVESLPDTPAGFAAVALVGGLGRVERFELAR